MESNAKETMERRRGMAVAAAFLLVLLGTCFLLISPTAFADLDGWLKDHQHLAGWVQGVGTIAALGAGFAITSWQVRRTFEHDKRVRVWERNQAHRATLLPLMDYVDVVRAEAQANIRVLGEDLQKPVEQQRPATQQQLQPFANHSLQVRAYWSDVRSAQMPDFEKKWLNFNGELGYIPQGVFALNNLVAQVRKLEAFVVIVDDLKAEFERSFPRD